MYFNVTICIFFQKKLKKTIVFTKMCITFAPESWFFHRLSFLG
jgi:hypothetical protein